MQGERTAAMNAHEPLYRLLNTKYDPDREDEIVAVLKQYPELAVSVWQGPGKGGKPFVVGSTPLHYAANDGKLRLMRWLAHRLCR